MISKIDIGLYPTCSFRRLKNSSIQEEDVAGSIGGMTAEELLQKLKAFEAENPILKSKQSGGRGGGNANGATVQAKAKAL